MLNVMLFVAGLAALIIGANLLVRGASGFATTAGVSPLVIGLTIVAFGTSAPELGVSMGAALAGRSDLAAGNVVGSNIFNVLFILGISAIITPLAVNLQIIRQEVPIMIGASVLLLLLSLDGHLGVLDGGFLVFLLVIYTAFLILQSRRLARARDESLHIEDGPAARTAWDSRLPAQLVLIAGGLVALVVGSNMLVTSSVVFARLLGVSELVIALTIVAAGTSMPELATSVTAALKGQRDIAVGNVIGSNTFNILGCLGMSGLLAAEPGLVISATVLDFDIWVMLAVSLACLPVFTTAQNIPRWGGVLFLAYYIAYVAYLILVNQQDDVLRPFRTLMIEFFMPLTVVVLVIALLRKQRPLHQ